jgi:L-seryl-tRNA(Ser) seleniumtransferase
VPAVAMIRQSAGDIRARAERLMSSVPEIHAEILPGNSVIGGGATPEQSIPTWLVAIACPDANAVEAHLRAGDPPVIARIEDDRLILDLRTVFATEEAELAAALANLPPDRAPLAWTS